MTNLMLLALAAGAMFSLLGVAYRWGEIRHVSALHILAVLSLIGAVISAFQSAGMSAGTVPLRIWLWALAVGPSQYLVVYLIAAALKHGPLSPLWCAVSLSFMPVVPYSSLFFGESLSMRQLLALGVAVMAVLAASFSQAAPGKEGPRKSLSGGLVYGLILAAIFIVNSGSFIAAKDLAMWKTPAGQGYNDAYGPFYRLLLYGGIFVPTMAHLLITRNLRAPFWATLTLGGLATVGSFGGLTALMACASIPGASMTLQALGGIIAAGVLSVVLFKEKITTGWCVTMVLGIIAAGLNLWPVIEKMIM